MAAPNYGKGLMGLWKRGWHEIPHVMITFIPFAIGAPASVWWTYQLDKKNGPYYRRFKQEYLVIRPDDPRVPLLRTD